jgi:hypothetical protein
MAIVLLDPVQGDALEVMQGRVKEADRLRYIQRSSKSLDISCSCATFEVVLHEEASSNEGGSA